MDIETTNLRVVRISIELLRSIELPFAPNLCVLMAWLFLLGGVVVKQDLDQATVLDRTLIFLNIPIIVG